MLQDFMKINLVSNLKNSYQKSRRNQSFHCICVKRTILPAVWFITFRLISKIKSENNK